MISPAEYGLWIESPLSSYAVAYIEALLDALAAITDDTVRVAWGPDDDPDWLMDCQDYHDAELLLDATGNLDAPL
jgi:hypothetical protein